MEYAVKMKDGQWHYGECEDTENSDLIAMAAMELVLEKGHKTTDDIEYISI